MNVTKSKKLKRRFNFIRKMKKKHSIRQKEPSQRQLRVQELLKSALNEILLRGESKNPKLDNLLITITHVDVSPDLRNAKFYVVPSDAKKADSVINEFNISKKLGIISGTMRKRKYKNNVTVGSVVIVGLRDFEND